MKKLLSLVLICAMGLGMVSCVESEESPSVENIRNAKAKQLEALAELAKAQAEAAKITANAEAALLNAQAEYQKEMTKEAAEKFAVEIEKIKAQAEAAIAKALKNAEQYKQDLNEKLYTAYTNAVEDLADANSDLLTAKADLLLLEEGVITAEESAAMWIKSYEKDIAKYEAQLEILKDPKYTSVNQDSLYVLWAAADKKAKLERGYFDASEIAKAVDKAEETAKLAAGEFKTMFDEVTAESSNLLIVDRDNDKYWDYKKLNQYGTYDDGRMVIVKSITISEAKVNDHKNNLQNQYDAAVDAHDAALKNLEKAEAAVATANEFKAELVPAVEANDSAMVALANAWDNYNKIASSVADTVAKADDLKAAKADYKADTAALKALQKELAEVQGIQPKVKELTDNIAAAKKDVEAAKKVKDAAAKTVADKQAAYDKITDKTTVAAAQANLALAEANAALAKADADVKAAEAKVTVAQTAYDTFKAKYSTLLTGDAAADKAAVENKVKSLNQRIYRAEIEVVNSTKAVADAETALAEAKAKVVDPEAAEETLVAAEAVAKTAHAALEALVHPEEETEYYEWIKYVYNSTEFPHIYNRSVVVDEDGNTMDVWGLIDRNADGKPDYNSSNTGNTLVKDWSFYAIDVDLDQFDAKIVTLEENVLAQKDAVTRANYTFAAVNEWMKDPAAAEAAMRAAVDSLNAQIAVVVAAYEAYDEAEAAADEAEAAVIALEAEAEALWTLYDEAIDIDTQIKDIERHIAYRQLWIEQQKNNIHDAEALVELKKEEIAALEAEIEVLEKMVETAKANLDAAVAAE